MGAGRLTAEIVLRNVHLVSLDDGVSPPHWGSDPDNYYDQNIAWFACALFNGSMANLWAGETSVQWDQVVVS